MFDVSHLFVCFRQSPYTAHLLGDLASRIVPVQIVLHILLLVISRSCSIPSMTFGLLTIPGGSTVDSPADYHPCTKWFLLQTGIVLTLYHDVTAEQCHASWQHQVLAKWQNLSVGWKPKKACSLSCYSLSIKVNCSEMISNQTKQITYNFIWNQINHWWISMELNNSGMIFKYTKEIM